MSPANFPPNALVDQITWKDVWNSSATYAKNDAVSYQGGSWICLIAHSNQTPESGTYWAQLASKGDQGIQGTQGIQGVKGDTGSTGATGAKGDIGNTGSAATISVNSTTTGAAGTLASVSNSGTSSAASLNFTIPRGNTGVQGNPGTAATVGVGTVTTGAAGSSAAVTNSGTSSAATLDFTIPKGDTGSQGIQGIQGPTGPTGVIAASPTGVLSYNSGTQTVSLDQTALSITKSQAGLANVDNTADTAKPVSTVQQTALDTKVTSSASLPSTGTDLTGTYASPTLVSKGTAGAQSPKVTTDAQGRVISSAALAATDIPSLDAGKVTSGTFALARIPTGNTSSTVTIGNDSRLSDARTPTSHASTHGLLGADSVTIDATYQIGSGTVPLARLGGITIGQLSLGTVTNSGNNLSTTSGSVWGNKILDTGSQWTITQYTATGAVGSYDGIHLVTTGGITLTLLSALASGGIQPGRTLIIKNNASTSITVKTASGEYIDGTNRSSTGFTLATNTALRLAVFVNSIAAANNWITL